MGKAFRSTGGTTMTRRVVRVSVGGVVALLLASWLMMNLERVPVHRREAPQAEARRNPWLAAERFTARMCGRLTRQSDARILDRLPAGATLLLDRQRPHVLSAERLRRLLAWIEDGGYLIAVAELPGVDDPLLDTLGVRRLEPSPATAAQWSPVLQVTLPGAARSPTIDASGHLLQADGRQPVWSAGQPGFGQQILHFDIGRGHLTLASDLDEQLSNRRIGEREHAELYWTLLGRYSGTPQPEVLLLSRLQMPRLGEWIWQHAWAACVATATLVVLWLWRIVPRFGGAQAEAPPARRELREHLAAVARHQWRSGALAVLLEPAREHFRNRLGQRQPAIAAQPAETWAAALAVLSSQPVGRIAAALAGRVATANAFTDAMRTLQELERHL